MRPVPGPPVLVWPDKHRVEYPAEAPDTYLSIGLDTARESSSVLGKKEPNQGEIFHSAYLFIFSLGEFSTTLAFCYIEAGKWWNGGNM